MEEVHLSWKEATFACVLCGQRGARLGWKDTDQLGKEFFCCWFCAEKVHKAMEAYLKDMTSLHS